MGHCSQKDSRGFSLKAGWGDQTAGVGWGGVGGSMKDLLRYQGSEVGVLSQGA